MSVMVDTHVGGNGSAPMYKSGPHCWACGYTDTPYIQGTRIRARNAAVLYEIAVETVEDMTGPFTVAELWNAARPKATQIIGPDMSGYEWGVSAYTYCRYAVRDLYAHGLLVCVRKDTSGRRCLAWAKKGDTDG